MMTRPILFLAVCLLVVGDSLAQNTSSANHSPLPYAIVGTGQTKCFSDRGEISPPRPGQPFYGQDAQFPGRPFNYTLSKDRLTVDDRNTGLTWQHSPDTNGDGRLTIDDKLSWHQMAGHVARLNSRKFGGYGDWRLPSIKELYSLFDASGTDPSGPDMRSTSGARPFINTDHFEFSYGFVDGGERIIDSQWASSTKYVGTLGTRREQLFGVNFADGRIKGYGLQTPDGREKTFFVLCVRGNPNYGKNDFRDTKKGTILDRATGLMWTKRDSGKGMNWAEALAWVQAKNAERYLGHNDWRLPNVKELQSIVDYSRSPDKTGSAAIDPLFECTKITNENSQADWPYYWTSTTHVGHRGGHDADYIAFGRAAGWMPRHVPPRSGPTREPGRPEFDRPEGRGRPRDARGAGGDGEYAYRDVHGAGAQRTDPKMGDPSRFSHGRGPQGDVVRINNFVRLVRGAR